MNHRSHFLRFFLLIVILAALSAITLRAAETHKFVLVAGTVKEIDRTGHHDYLGGCRLLEQLLAQSPGVETILVTGGSPEDEGVRKLMVNGILWSAGREIPAGGASCSAGKASIDSFLTPRTAPKPKKKNQDHLPTFPAHDNRATLS